jgi:hypothetical protein
MVRLVYLASFVMVMTTAAGLIWLNLLNRFLKDIGEPIPMAGPLSALLAALVLGMVAYLIWTAKSVTAEAHSHRS